jgi:enediyne polyketide synthase
MGERLGRIDALLEQGITPISPDSGVAVLQQLISDPSTPYAVVVSGRMGSSPTLKVDRPELPLHRFIEDVKIYYPGIELVVEATLTPQTDPYLLDHVFRGEMLFPAVMGLEAMAQVAGALSENQDLPAFEQVEFNRAIVIPADGSIVIRVAALDRGGGAVEVVIRSSSTGFQLDHFRCRCRFQSHGETKGSEDSTSVKELPLITLDPKKELYGGILFQGARFQRLRGYRRIAAKECIAEIESSSSAKWFGGYLPSDFVLGDPGRRDAAIHGIQVCVPNVSLLPVGIDRLIINRAVITSEAQGGSILSAREKVRVKDQFIYDLEVRASDGSLLEIWEGLRLLMISGSESRGPWVGPLLAPYMERRIEAILPDAELRLAVEPGHDERGVRSDRAIQRAIDTKVQILRRFDGKPEASDEHYVSASHCSGLTLAVAGLTLVGCDMEPVAVRADSIWRDLLGVERFSLAEQVSALVREDRNRAATRVWCASECLKKAGASPVAPLIFGDDRGEGWVVLRSGAFIIATYAAIVNGRDSELVLAVLGAEHGRDTWRVESVAEQAVDVSAPTMSFV